MRTHSEGFAETALPYLHDLVLKAGEEVVDDLVLFDGERVEVDLLHGLDLSELDKTTKLGDGLPLLLLVLVGSATSTATSTSTATITTTTAVTATRCESAASSCCVGHIVDLKSVVAGIRSPVRSCRSSFGGRIRWRGVSVIVELAESRVRLGMWGEID